MKIDVSLFFSTLLLTICVTGVRAQQGANQGSLPPYYMPSGQRTYQLFCASCHGENGKGNGPTAKYLKVPPPDLTSLAKRHDGKFPYDEVTKTLRLGTEPSAHGSSDMPVWGPIFQYFDDKNEGIVRQRIDNLCKYLASLQAK
jgi:mono/diheme cytochrome c family protein